MDRVLPVAAHRAAAHPNLLRRLLRAVASRRSRHRLAELDDHILRDVGLTREQARHEAEKANWDAPSHWYR